MSSVFLISIDNFENYVQNYTTLASDKLLQTYIAIIKSVVGENDYLGEIKENEFLLISENIDTETVANYLTYAFETVSSKFYSIEDNKRGYIIAEGDGVSGRRVNFVHTTIAVISKASERYKDAGTLFNSLLHLHKTAKIPTKSNYLIERPQLQGEITENSPAKNIVISENDDALRTLLKTILELQGYSVQCTNSPDEIFTIEKPELIILDAGESTDLSGLETCKSIKNNNNFMTTKIILTTVLHDKELVLNCGADVYLPKPYEITSLIKWVENLLND